MDTITVLVTYSTHSVLQLVEVGCSGYGPIAGATLVKAYSYICPANEWFSL